LWREVEGRESEKKKRDGDDSERRKGEPEDAVSADEEIRNPLVRPGNA
jgi:hypothetical protein